MSSGGRPNHPIWDKGYKKLKEDNKVLALCTVCNKKIHNTSSSRLSMHRNVCTFSSKSIAPAALTNRQSAVSRAPNKERGQSTKRSRVKNSDSSSFEDEEDIAFDDEDAIEIDDSTENEKTDYDQETPSSSSFSRPSTSASLISFMDQMSQKEINKTNNLLGTFFFGCNIPFSVIDSTHFRNLIHHLRPSYPLPSRRALSGKILDDVHSKFTENIKFESESVMLIDGWKNENANTKNVTVLLHSASGKAIFLDNWDVSEEKETGEKLSEIIELSKVLAEKEYNTKIFAVVSDNAANMMKMGRLTDILHLTCNSHTGQLLAKDVMPHGLATQVTSILKKFNGPQLEAKILKLGGSRIVLPCETRWCSNRDSFACFLKNLPYIKRLISESPEQCIPAPITAMIFDQEFINKVTEAVSLLDPICELINKCQASTASIACAAEAWLSIKLPPGFVDAEEHLEKRKKYALKDPLLIANYLHPVHRGRKLSSEQIDRVNDYLLENLDATGLEDLLKFNNNADIFDILNKKKDLKPHLYWELASKKCSSLGNLAKKFLSIPASSAQLERVFSNWSYVHNKVRNRLGAEKSKKLVKVYYALKTEDSSKSNEY